MKRQSAGQFLDVIKALMMAESFFLEFKHDRQSGSHFWFQHQSLLGTLTPTNITQVCVCVRARLISLTMVAFLYCQYSWLRFAAQLLLS